MPRTGCALTKRLDARVWSIVLYLFRPSRAASHASTMLPDPCSGNDKASRVDVDGGDNTDGYAGVFSAAADWVGFGGCRLADCASLIHPTEHIILD